MKKWLTRGIWILIAAALVVGLVFSLRPGPVPVDVGTVTRGAMELTVDEDGPTRVKDRYLVSASVTGSMARVELHAGDAVKPGDVIARIAPLEPPLLDARTRQQAEARIDAARALKRQAGAAIERAQTAYDFAQKELERQTKLVAEGVGTAQARDLAAVQERSRAAELASARFGARVADHELTIANAALTRLTDRNAPAGEVEVTSPVGGRVLRVFHESEGVVQAGTPLIEVGDPAALEIVIDVLTADAVDIEPGAPVRIEQWGGPRPLSGRVRVVEPSAFTRVSALGVEEQRVNVIVDIADPHEDWARLGDGYRVEARIVTWDAADVLKVDSSAVFRKGEEWAVFRVVDGVARRTVVELGRQTPREVEIRGGVEEGAPIILYPGETIADGTKVAPRDQ